MAEVFDVNYVSCTPSGTIAANIPSPLFHVPAKGGCITVLEAFYVSGTVSITGTVRLIYGTLNTTNGTVVPAATIGTSFGTGGGTFPAMKHVALSLTADPCIVPAGNWVALQCSGTLAKGNQQNVFISYVTGKVGRSA